MRSPPCSSPVPFLTARSMESLGMDSARALSMAYRSRRLSAGFPPPLRAATVMYFASLEKIFPRFASAAPFLFLMDFQCEWPAMDPLRERASAPSGAADPLPSHCLARDAALRARHDPVTGCRLRRPFRRGAAPAKDDARVLGSGIGLLLHEVEEVVMENERLLGLHHLVEQLLLPVPGLSPAEDPDLREQGLQRLVQGKHGMRLPHPQDEVDGGAVDALHLLQVLPDLAQVLLREELEAHELALA